jgi:peptide chain release factor 1
MSIQTRAEEYREKLPSLEKQIADPAIFSDQQKFEEINREFQHVRSVVEIADKIDAARRQQADLKQVLDSESDPEYVELATVELADVEGQIPKLEQELRLALIPPDPANDKDAIIEIRAGAGGDEAALFAADLFRMYSRFAERHNKKIEVASQSLNDLGGMKEIIFELRGSGSYGDMRYESGVHRVQRVPATEKQGRIHTSTATVAVFPKVEAKEININPNDLDIEATTSTGAGGQSVNTTYSAIRIIHKPTGIMVYCQEERSQRQNKERALEIIRSRVYAYEEEKRLAKETAERRSKIGTGDRSEKIRTYNYPQDRVTDHRIKETWHNLTGIMDGDIDAILAALRLADQEV